MKYKKKVTVLMSTYNGEKYIKEQINSIINQVNVDVKLLIRDDGSKDSTIDILNDFAERYSFISWYNGNNLGPTNSFFDLLVNAGESDYYAFSDQDDVWDEEKLYVATNKLKTLDENKPNLYYSNLKIVDQNLNFYRNSHDKILFNQNRYSCLTENLCTGCTAVFNKTAKNLISKHIPDYCTMHDTWVYIVCKMLGNCIYDEVPHISYRQHQDNVVGSTLKKNNFKTLKEKVIRIFDRGLQPRYVNALNFYKSFENELTNEDKIKILKIINYKKSIYNRMSLFLDDDFSCTTLYGTLRFKLHVLWGTV